MSIVVQLAQRKKDDAARMLKECQATLFCEKDKAADLHRYYHTYEQRFSSKSHAIRASDLSHSRLFLQQLSQAIDGQRLTIEEAERQVLQAQFFWQQCHLKTKSLLELQQRYAKEENDEEDRREQRSMDEWVTLRRQ